MFFTETAPKATASGNKQPIQPPVQAPTAAYICTQCGEHFSQPKKFCAKCGTKIES